jgi:serine/threonine protein kinase
MTDVTFFKSDRYELRERIGAGGSARVYKAWDKALERFVAIKILHEHLADDPSFRERFEREAKFVASFNHPNIVQIYDFSISEGSEAPTYYMVMPLIPGDSLRVILERSLRSNQRLPTARIMKITNDILSALEYAHNRGMAHRDVKPGNILFNERDEAVLTDFGIARLMNSSRLTQEGVSTGTPTYMSPEQASGDAGDGRSDLYSLGIIVYEMLTGHPPYADENGMVVMLKHINEPVPSAATKLGLQQPTLDSFFDRALAKNPDERFQNTAEFRREFNQVFRDLLLENAEGEQTLIVAETDAVSVSSTNTPSRSISSTPLNRTAQTTRQPHERPQTTTLLQTLTQQALAHPQTSTGILLVIVIIIITLLVTILINQQAVNRLLATSQATVVSLNAPTPRPEQIPPLQADTGYFRSTFSERDGTRIHWPVGDFGQFSLDIADGQYRIANRAPQTAQSAIYQGSAAFSNISIVMEAQITAESHPNSAVGIIFSYRDARNYHVFAIDGMGRYSIWQLEDGNWRELRGAEETWSRNEVIRLRGQPNTLSVDIVSSRVTGYVNNRQLVRITDADISDGQVGIYIAADEEPAFILVDTYQVYASVPSMTGS